LKGRAKFKRRDAAPTSRDNFADTEDANDEIVTIVVYAGDRRTQLIPKIQRLSAVGLNGTGFAI